MSYPDEPRIPELSERGVVNDATLLLIDGHSLAFRAFYAFNKSRRGALRTSTGIPTSVCFGFLNSLIQVLESQQAKYIAVAFDRSEPSFRHLANDTYKANRKETPEEFVADLKNLRSLLEAFNIPMLTKAGFEADDLLGTLADKASKEGYRVKILTGDRDLFQLVDEEKKISVLYLETNAIKSPFSKGYTEFDSSAVEAKLGIKPSQVVDYKALSGDPSDNIAGVSGIGEKTAVKLLQEFGTLENIYQNLSEIKGVIKTKLELGQANAEHAQYLVKLALDVPLETSIENFHLQGFDRKAVKPLLKKLELKTFLQKLDEIQEKLGGSIEPIISEVYQTNQLSLFDGEITNNPLSLTSLTEENNQLDRDKKTKKSIIIKPKIIDTVDKLNELVTHLIKSSHLVAWDTETTALDPSQATLVGLGCCWGENVTDIAYIPLNHTDGNYLNQEKVLDVLRPILESETYYKAFQNTKFDRLVLKHQGIQLAGFCFDTMLASYVLHPELNHSLSDLCDRYLSNIVSQSYKELAIPKGKTIADLDIATVANYCGMDAYATFNLVPKLQAELENVPELNKLLLNVELPLEEVLSEMEARGVRIDVEYLKSVSQQLEQDLKTFEEKAYQAAGQSFNLGSPKQMSDILFEKLGLNKKKSRKIKTGYSTDHFTLEKLKGDHPVIDYILEHRTLAKLKSTYVDALPALLDPKTGRIHTNFNQAVTTTGRLSSSNPNLQNIPIRTEFSRRIRQAFIPEEGWLLVSADYSQIELRILAHLSQEPVLLEAYRTNQDVHSVTAKLLFDKENITPRERYLGKTINFGVIYGMGAQRLAREAKVSVEDGRKFINKYQERYSNIFNYLERMRKEAISQGFVQTILGRRRYFNFSSPSLQQHKGVFIEEIDLEDLKINYEDAQLLRAAANAPIQGSSADIIKIAMVKLHHILQNYQTRLLLQVHDELVFEVPVDEWEKLQLQIKTTMENAVNLSIPLVVDVYVGKNWMEAK